MHQSDVFSVDSFFSDFTEKQNVCVDTMEVAPEKRKGCLRDTIARRRIEMKRKLERRHTELYYQCLDKITGADSNGLAETTYVPPDTIGLPEYTVWGCSAYIAKRLREEEKLDVAICSDYITLLISWKSVVDEVNVTNFSS